ncbi:MAG: response regulator transcription factor [Lachnospiraceae bacterium]|nr:response regulator transcription factor [Lachnospiraceae bacterium]
MAAVILLVEDDYALAMGTQYALEKEGYEVLHASSLKEAYLAMENNINLIVLDVMLPDGSGYDFCKQLREKQIHIPIIFLTAMSEEINVVQGLEMGGDDYIAKPYRVKELMSRIAANLRRFDYNLMTANKQKTSSYCFGKHTFLVEEFKLLREGNIVECTPSELRLLKEFILNEGLVLTRSNIMDRLYDIDGVLVDDNTLSVYIKRLRDKLLEDACHIETIRGIGYKFTK